ANSTLRLTFGNIKGYSQVDATYMAPFTTIKGLIERGNSGLTEYADHETIKTACLAKNYAAYANRGTHGVPGNIQYNMDGNGSNSGSQILNEHREVIGVNYARADDATINDHAPNEHYRR